MFRYFGMVVAFMVTVPAIAETEKEINCGYQADVVEAIKQARIGGVAQEDLSTTLAANAGWPDKYNNIIPILAPSIYEKSPEQLAEEDLASWWRGECMKLDQ